MTQFISSLNATLMTFIQLLLNTFRDANITIMEVDENGFPTQRNQYYT